MNTPRIVQQKWLALASLIGSGALVGLSTNLAKVAFTQGLAPLPFLTWSLAGATLILGLISSLKKQDAPKNTAAIKYYFIAGFFSVAGSNLIFFSAVPHVGVSFVALVISLPPIITYVAALMLGMETFNRWRAAGVIFALSGTALLVAAQWSAPDTSHLWIIITLLGALLLASGNIYRTTHWPTAAKPEALAPGMLLAATTTLSVVAVVIPGWSLSALINTENLILISFQATIFSAQFLLLFILQKVGGPVFLSLTGAVSATFAIPFAMVLLDEAMLPALIPSALFIVTGIVCMMKAQVQATSAMSLANK